MATIEEKLEILKVLEKIKKIHLKDVEFCKGTDLELDGLCGIGMNNLNPTENRIFRNYLQSCYPNRNLSQFIWKQDNKNKSRINWLNKHIKLNS